MNRSAVIKKKALETQIENESSVQMMGSIEEVMKVLDKDERRIDLSASRSLTRRRRPCSR